MIMGMRMTLWVIQALFLSPWNDGYISLIVICMSLVGSMLVVC